MTGHLLTELANRVPAYTMPDCIWDAYEEELSMWQCNGWLLPYPEEEVDTHNTLDSSCARAQAEGPAGARLSGVEQLCRGIYC